MFEKTLKNGFFSFHIVTPSPWPLFTSLSSFSIIISIVGGMYSKNMLSFNMFFSFLFFFLCFFSWQKDILHESCSEGKHTKAVQKGLKMGMILFILSEVLFFFSFFWSLFYLKLSPSVTLGVWPPYGVKTLDPLGTPLLGTLVLMSSGVTITSSHHFIMDNKWKESTFFLFITIFLGLVFSILQYSEYLVSPFTISDSVYGSIFYMMTGFHGLHVIIGSLFLSVCFFRFFSIYSFSSQQHIGFEMSIWYWHFVDVVWLFLFFFLYF